MTFPLDKILTLRSLREYTESQNTSITNYEVRGVHCSISSSDRILSVIENFAKKVPEGTEAVIDYREFATTYALGWTAHGTASIPRI